MPVFGFDPATSFGPDAAAGYDDELRGDEDVAADLLAELAQRRSALEFAIGTGRIAVPLAGRGVRVDGIELSPDMVAQLRDKPAAAEMDIHIGDMTTTSTGRRYPLVYLVYYTFFNVLTQDGQVAIFENAAPSELDLMARLSGLRLRDRWGGWQREQYTGEGMHVSVYSR